jgi:hypothetical protein
MSDLAAGQSVHPGRPPREHGPSRYTDGSRGTLELDTLATELLAIRL